MPFVIYLRCDRRGGPLVGEVGSGGCSIALFAKAGRTRAVPGLVLMVGSSRGDCSPDIETEVCAAHSMLIMPVVANVRSSIPVPDAVTDGKQRDAASVLQARPGPKAGNLAQLLEAGGLDIFQPETVPEAFHVCG